MPTDVACFERLSRSADETKTLVLKQLIGHSGLSNVGEQLVESNNGSIGKPTSCELNEFRPTLQEIFEIGLETGH